MTCGTCFSLSGDANGVLVQLAANASGAANRYISMNPQVTYFRQEYKRVSNFGKGECDMAFQTQSDWGRPLICKWQRNGDAAHELYLQLCIERVYIAANTITNTLVGHPNFGFFVDPAKAIITWVNCLGQVAVDVVELVIGGSNIDKIQGELLHIWAQFAYADEVKLREMIGEFDNLDDLRAWSAKDRVVHVPLPFYFAHPAYPDNVLPVIALQNHDIVVTVCLKPRNDLIKAYDPSFGIGPDFDICNGFPLTSVLGGSLMDARLTINWVYLDVAERTMMAQSPHEFLIVQHQMNCEFSVNAGLTQACILVNFNHPVIEYFWLFQEQIKEDCNDWFDFSLAEDPALIPTNFPWASANNPPPPVDPFSSIEITVNGHDRVAQRDGAYFRTVVPGERHTRKPTRFLYNYVFSMEPEDVSKPSGGENHSRIDTVQMKAVFDRALPNTANVRIYCRNHNVVKISGGMLALRFAN